MEDIILPEQKRHNEMMEVLNQHTRLLTLSTAEKRVNNARLDLLEKVIKDVLIELKGFGSTGKKMSDTCQELLDELRA